MARLLRTLALLGVLVVFTGTALPALAEGHTRTLNLRVYGMV